MSLDTLGFELPPGVIGGQPQRWRHRDPSGASSTPDGIVSLSLRRIRNSTSYRLNVRGRNAELSAFDGTTDRAITIGVGVGNDCASTTVSFV